MTASYRDKCCLNASPANTSSPGRDQADIHIAAAAGKIGVRLRKADGPAVGGEHVHPVDLELELRRRSSRPGCPSARCRRACPPRSGGPARCSPGPPARRGLVVHVQQSRRLPRGHPQQKNYRHGHNVRNTRLLHRVSFPVNSPRRGGREHEPPKSQQLIPLDFSWVHTDFGHSTGQSHFSQRGGLFHSLPDCPAEIVLADLHAEGAALGLRRSIIHNERHRRWLPR